LENLENFKKTDSNKSPFNINDYRLELEYIN
jgi:hypothetical protein